MLMTDMRGPRPSEMCYVNNVDECSNQIIQLDDDDD